MPRQARVIIPGMPYHIVQRGNYRANIFDSDEDKAYYLDALHFYRKQHKVKFYAWCLMDNHVHLILEPEDETSFQELFRRLNVKYSHYIHRKRGVKGKLWEDRYYTSCLDDEYFVTAIKYVELNPTRACMEKEPGFYQWSSFMERNGWTQYHILDKLPDFIKPKDWKQFILDGLNDEEKWNNIKQSTKQNTPIGSDSFISTLEKISNKILSIRNQNKPKHKTIVNVPI